MEDIKFRCRKCRHVLFAMSNLITSKAKSLESESDLDVDCPNMLWFIDIDSHPDWIASSLESSQFSKGKLCCERCEGRVGAFDFMSVIRCVCGKHNIPPIRVAKNRVDLCVPIPSPQTSDVGQSNHESLDRNDGMEVPSLSATDEQQSGGANGSPLHAETADKWATSTREMDAILQSGLSNSGLHSEGLRSRRAPGSGSRSHSHRKVRSNRHEESDSVVPGDTDSDSGIQSKPASDSESEGSQQPQGHVENKDRLINTEDDSGNRFQQLQETSEKQENVENANVENVGLANVPTNLVDFDGYTCPICLDVYYAPHTCHPCQHVFCSPCLRRLHASIPVHTKCPLCRQVICACIPNHELNNRIKLNFPREYKARQALEKKVKNRLPPLPSSPQLISFGRRGNSRSRNIILAHWAGVCFVVLLVMFAIAILATTVGMVLWYLWEISMDYFIELVVVVDDAFNSAWETVVLTLFEGGVSPQVAKVMMGSFGHVLHTFGKFFNKSLEKAAELAAEHGAKGKAKVQEGYQYLSSAMQADIANYILIMGIVTYLVYKFAKHRQATLEARGGVIH